MTNGGTDQSAPKNALPLYAETAQKLLDEEDQRKTSIEQKGAAVLTTSGVLVTLLFAFASLAHPQLNVSGVPLYFLGAALVMFVVAAILGVLSTWLLHYPILPAETVRDLVLNWWDKPYEPAQRRLAEAKANILARARVQNTLKGRALVGAQSAQILAVLLAGVAVIVILLAPVPSSGKAAASPTPSVSSRP